MKFASRLLSILFAAGLIFSSWQPALAQSAQPQTISGWFTIVWGDVRSNGSGTSSYLLTDDTGQTLTLALNETLAAPLGGVLALDRHRIRVAGIRQASAAELGSAPTFQVDSISLADSAEGVTAQALSPQAVTGSHPFISIMCKFKDVGTEPKTLTYFQNMYSSVHPGLDNYWQEVSYLTANIAGSTAVGWYTLPQNRSYYIPVNGSLDFGKAATDCTAAAAAHGVNFALYATGGINMMFNEVLDGFAWGGSYCLTLSGINKCWPMTWEPPWGYKDITVIAHEMGHAFGLPHSSGQYGQTYDNHWDVMSDGWSDCANATDATYGCLGQQTISYHKDKLGWIPANKKLTVTGNVTITLEELALPQTGNYLMVQIPIGGSTTHFYTVEVRRKVGYDVKLPGQGVVIHDVDLTRLCPANVIDADGNGNTGDLGAIWTVGERFSDAANGIYVKVVSASATGFAVSIQIPAVFTSVADKDGWTIESSENSNIGSKVNGTALTMGDNATNRQYRSVLHFDTSSLPDNAVVTGATLRIMKQGLVGTNPFTTHGKLLGDIVKPFLGVSDVLEVSDFQAAVNAKSVFSFGASPAGSWYVATMSSVGAPYINRTASTQLRLRFAVDDNNDLGADYMSFYSGEAAAGNRPRLIVKYYLP